MKVNKWLIFSKQTSKQASSRNLQIEGLRGFAILIIVLFHMFDRYQQIYLDQSVRWMDFLGSFGVGIFMTISAYFLINSKSSRLTFRDAVIIFRDKLLKLWPSYAIAITIIFIVTHIWELPGRTVGVKEYLLNLLFLNKLFGLDYVDGAHWYLSVLLSLNIVILLLRVLNIHKNPLAYLIWCFLAFVLHIIATNNNKFFVSDIYLLGGPYVSYVCIIISAQLINKKSFYDRDIIGIFKDNYKWLIVDVFALFVMYFSRGIIYVLEFIVIIPLFIMCLENRMRALQSTIILWLGAASYPVYLIHQNMGFLIQNQLASFIGDWNYAIPIIATVIVILLGYLLSCVPVIRYKRTIDFRLHL